MEIVLKSNFSIFIDISNKDIFNFTFWKDMNVKLQYFLVFKLENKLKIKQLIL